MVGPTVISPATSIHHRIALMLDQSVLLLGIVPFLVAHLRDDNKVDMHTRCTFNHRYVKSNPPEVENATWMLTVTRMMHGRIDTASRLGQVAGSSYGRVPHKASTIAPQKGQG